MRALHFAKGCYLGQEIVERIRSRGNVHRHLRPLELTGPVPASGTELFLPGGAPAGHVTSAAALPLANAPRVSRSPLCVLKPRCRTSPLTTPTVDPRVQPAFWLSRQPFRTSDRASSGKTSR